MYDLIIIGGGPAGCSAAVYAARKLLKTVVITDTFGGQSVASTNIQNWIGTPTISGDKLATDLEAHVRTYAGEVVTIKTGEWVSALQQIDGGWRVTSDAGTYDAKAVLIATGGARRQLDAPGAKEFEHKGLTYCASCDGPLFAGQDVAVVGGGNAAFETAAQLLAYCHTVTILSRSDFRADPITVKAVLAHPAMKSVIGAEITKVTGEKFVKGLSYKDASGEHDLAVTGIFVEIGLLPSTSYAKGVVEMDSIGRIVVDARSQQTSAPGIWAAGDCTNELYHQNNIAAGDAVKALEDIYVHLKAK